MKGEQPREGKAGEVEEDFLSGREINHEKPE
jgi:hypothetical protein